MKYPLGRFCLTPSDTLLCHPFTATKTWQLSKNRSKESNDKINEFYVAVTEIDFHLGLNLWKLTEENRLINRALNLRWKYGDKEWIFDPHFSTISILDTINVLEIIRPNTNLNKKVQDGTEVDLRVLKEETDQENLQSDTRLQKWERERESFISRKSRYKKPKKEEWMKIKSLLPGQEKYLEVSHCGRLLTIQGELRTKKIL